MSQSNASADWRMFLGMGLLVAASALFPCAMVGLLGILLFPAGLAFVLLGAEKAEGMPPTSKLRRATGIVVVFLAVFVCGRAMLDATFVIFDAKMAQLRGSVAVPTTQNDKWLSAASFAILATAIFAVGVRLCARLSRTRWIVWTLSFLMLTPAAVAAFEIVVNYFDFPLTD